MDLSIVIPLYNEEETLRDSKPTLIEEITLALKPLNLTYEVIMVDDGSTDGSWAIVSEAQKQYPTLKGIRFQRNYGKSAALYKGFEKAQGNVVITMDADGQDNPKELSEMYRLIAEEGYDLVSGWKKVRHDPFSKTFPSKFFNALTRMASGIKLHDFNCGFKAYKSEVVKSIEVYGEMHRYVPLLAKFAGFKNIKEKVVEHRAREHGKSKFGGLDRGVKGMLDLMSIFITQKYLKRPMHFFGLWGGLFSFIGGMTMLYLFVVKVFLGIGITSRLPAMIFGATALLMGLMLFSIGLLGELIGRNSSTRNDYKVREEM